MTLPSKKDFDSLKSEVSELKSKIEIRPPDNKFLEDVVSKGGELISDWISSQETVQKHAIDKNSEYAMERLKQAEREKKRSSMEKIIFITGSVISIVVLSFYDKLSPALIAVFTAIIVSAFRPNVGDLFKNVNNTFGGNDNQRT